MHRLYAYSSGTQEGHAKADDVKRLLGRAPAAELPVERPASSRRPRSLLWRADEVIA